LRAAIDPPREKNTDISNFALPDAELKDDWKRISPTAGAIQRSAANGADADARNSSVCSGTATPAGDVEAHHFGIAFSFVLLAAVFIVSISVVAVGAILLAIGLVVCAGMLRAQHPSDIDIYLDAMAWMILGVTLGIVVARAVFALGRVTFHRVVGAVLLYLCIGLVFVSLYCFVALREPKAFSGLPALHDNLAVAGNLIYLNAHPGSRHSLARH
jgi:hypothetical protein